MSNFTPPPMIPPTSGSFPQQALIPVGTYPARCTWLVLSGTVDTEYKGEKKKKTNLLIGFELPTLLLPEDHPRKGEPSFLTETHSFSFSEKANLRKFVNSWRGANLTDEECKTFDISKLLKAPCYVTIVHNTGKGSESKTYANVGSIAPEASMKSLLGDNYKVKPQVNKEVYFNVFWLNSVNSAEYAISVFNDLPKWVQDKIMLSDEWKAYAVCNYYIAPTIAVAPPVSQPVANPVAGTNLQPQTGSPQVSQSPSTPLVTGNDDFSDLPF